MSGHKSFIEISGNMGQTLTRIWAIARENMINNTKYKSKPIKSSAGQC